MLRALLSKLPLLADERKDGFAMEEYSISPLVYAEVYAILQTFSTDLIEKLPDGLMESIDMMRDEAYISVIDKSKPLREQNIEKETFAFMAWLKLNYWCKDEAEQEEMLKVLHSNEVTLQKMRAQMKFLAKKGFPLIFILDTEL